LTQASTICIARTAILESASPQLKKGKVASTFSKIVATRERALLCVVLRVALWRDWHAAPPDRRLQSVHSRSCESTLGSCALWQLGCGFSDDVPIGATHVD
jgi:hypothetical protein